MMKTQRIIFRSRWIVFQWLSLLAVFALQGVSDATDIYVSVDGNSQADGSLTRPYGSLPDAVNAVRALRKAGDTEPAVIILREGRHQLDQTLVLGMEDGSPTPPGKPVPAGDVAVELHGAGESTGPASLTFAAFPGEHPVVSAGVPVTGWKQLDSTPDELPVEAAGKVWVADMPSAMGRFYTLYDAKGRLSRSRGDGFSSTQNGNSRTLYFPKGALKSWDNLGDVEIQVRPGIAYEINMLPLESVDEATGVATTKVSAAGRIGSLPPYLLELMGDSAVSVWVENILEEPGEWVVNTKTRKIYLWPANPAADGSPQRIFVQRLLRGGHQHPLSRKQNQTSRNGPRNWRKKTGRSSRMRRS